MIALTATACSVGSGGVAPAPTTLAPSTVPTSTSTTTPATTTTTIAPTTTTSAPTTTTAPPDLDRLAHSVLMIGLPGAILDDATRSQLGAGAAGLVLFGDNIDGAESLRALTGAAACAAGGPLLIAVDQELGIVDRLDGLISPLPSIDEVRAMPLEEVEAVAERLGRDMLGLGINVDLAPVVDVVTGDNPVLAGRNLGSDPAEVGAIGAAFVRGLTRAGVVAVPKHFPGHGRSTVDPHQMVTPIDASRADLEAVDFPPFADVFAAGAPAVMVGHPVYRALDPDRPASLSSAVLALLREDFGFEGVAMTDSLSMAGVATGRTPGEIAVQALRAGEDLLLVVDPAQVGPMAAAIIAAVEGGDLSLTRLAEASARVRALAETAGQIACPA